jgi:hypothetical protein
MAENPNEALLEALTVTIGYFEQELFECEPGSDRAVDLKMALNELKTDRTGLLDRMLNR